MQNYTKLSHRTINFIDKTTNENTSCHVLTNTQPKPKVKSFFGELDSGLSFNIRKAGESYNTNTSKEDEITIWLSTWNESLNKYVPMSDEAVQNLIDKYGSTCYATPEGDIISSEEYEQLQSTASTSQSASNPF